MKRIKYDPRKKPYPENLVGHMLEGYICVDGGLTYDMILNEVNNNMSKLSDRQRLVVELRYEKGLKLGEISAVLGVSRERVSHMVHGYILRELRSSLFEDGRIESVNIVKPEGGNYQRS